ncbi:MAG: PmoA family protein [Gemmatales bacterium]
MFVLALFLVMLLSPQQPGGCTIKKIGNMLELKIGDAAVGRYLFDPSQPRPHFHPLYTPEGKLLTRQYPMKKDVPGETKDHVHHRGCWVGHQIVILEKPGEKQINANFWAEAVNPVQQQLGKQICTRVEDVQNGSGSSSVVMHNSWQTAGGIKMMDEKRTLHLVNLGTAQLIVFDIDFHASQGDITFGDEKDGFMAIRVADVMAEKSKKDGIMTNAEGKQHMGANNNKDRQGCWGLRSAWVDYSGKVDGVEAGLTVMDHPRNSIPACWHARDYGLLTANPFGRKHSNFPDAKGDVVKLKQGEHLTFRYGVLIHSGNVEKGEVARHYQRFVELK